MTQMQMFVLDSRRNTWALCFLPQHAPNSGHLRTLWRVTDPTIL